MLLNILFLFSVFGASHAPHLPTPVWHEQETSQTLFVGQMPIQLDVKVLEQFVQALRLSRALPNSVSICLVKFYTLKSLMYHSGTGAGALYIRGPEVDVNLVVQEFLRWHRTRFFTGEGKLEQYNTNENRKTQFSVRTTYRKTPKGPLVIEKPRREFTLQQANAKGTTEQHNWTADPQHATLPFATNRSTQFKNENGDAKAEDARKANVEKLAAIAEDVRKEIYERQKGLLLLCHQYQELRKEAVALPAHLAAEKIIACNEIFTEIKNRETCLIELNATLTELNATLAAEQCLQES